MHARHDSTSLPARDAMRSSESELAVRVHDRLRAGRASQWAGLLGPPRNLPILFYGGRHVGWSGRWLARWTLKSGLQLLDDVRRSRWLSKANFSATGGGCLGGQNGLG